MLKPLLTISAATLFAAVALTSASSSALAQTPKVTEPATALPQQTTEAAPTPPASTNPVKPTAASQEKAKKLYAQDCSICHGESGSGKTDLAKDMQLKLLDWTDPQALVSHSDQELFHIIRTGKDKMPAEEVGRAKNDEVWNLVIYIRGLSKNQPAVEDKPAATDQPAAPADKPGK